MQYKSTKASKSNSENNLSSQGSKAETELTIKKCDTFNKWLRVIPSGSSKIVNYLKSLINVFTILFYLIAAYYLEKINDIYLFPIIYLILFYSALVIGYKITKNKINFFLWREPQILYIIKAFCVLIFMIYGVLLFTKIISPHIGTAILGLTFCLVIYFMLSNNITNRLAEHSTKHEHIRKDLANLYKQHKKFLLYFFKRVLFEIKNQKERNKIMLEELGNTIACKIDSNKHLIEGVAFAINENLQKGGLCKEIPSESFIEHQDKMIKGLGIDFGNKANTEKFILAEQLRQILRIIKPECKPDQLLRKLRKQNLIKPYKSKPSSKPSGKYYMSSVLEYIEKERNA